MQRSDFEIMAPAGSRETLAAALQAGADSVYFGIGALNMRAHSAGGFTIDDLNEIAALCREHGAKSYLTVNTVIYDGDLAAMREIVSAAKAAGVSAVIASDVAVMQCCRELGVEVHLSTQLNIANVEALRFLRAVRRRRRARARADAASGGGHPRRDRSRGHQGPLGQAVRIEMFCHGALCMAVSGKCWLSLHTRGKSANRGECLQSCRRDYIAVDRERGTEIALDNGYFMSPKDLKTIAFLDLMVKAGVTVFKIEGRARGPEYVRTAVECYGEALDAILEGRWSEEVSKSWDERLSTVFNRGFWDGWYQGATMLERTDRYGSRATKKKLYCGKCTATTQRRASAASRSTVRRSARATNCSSAGRRRRRLREARGAARRRRRGCGGRQGDDVTFRVPEKIQGERPSLRHARDGRGRARLRIERTKLKFRSVEILP